MTVLSPTSEENIFGDWNIVGSFSRAKSINPDFGDANYIYIDASSNQSITVRMIDAGPIADGASYLKFRTKRLSGDGTIQVIATVRAADTFSIGSDGYMFTSSYADITSSDWKTTSYELDDRANRLLALGRGKIYVSFKIVNTTGLGTTQLGLAGLWIETPQADGGTFTQVHDSYPPVDQLVTVETGHGKTGTAKWDGDQWLNESDEPFEYANETDMLDIVYVTGWHV